MTSTSAVNGIKPTSQDHDSSIISTEPRQQGKLHGRAFYESIGSPKLVMAPMVDQSEFVWRMLVRSFLPKQKGSEILTYTPMFHARLYAEGAKYRNHHFQAVRTTSGQTKHSKRESGLANGVLKGSQEPELHLDGNPAVDRPLFVQFCANDPTHFLEAAKHAAPYCDAVDLNLGCPQGIARKGHYGAFLQEEPNLIHDLIRKLHKELPVPVTAKMRVLETPEATLEYAKGILKSGASIICVHGRRREMKGHATGLADWKIIRYLRDNLPPETVLFANGNVLQHGDLERCLRATGADGVMTAEGALSDPTIFAEAPSEDDEELRREYWRGRDGKGGFRVDAVLRRYFDLLHTYVLEHEPPAREPLWAPGDPLPPLAAKSPQPASTDTVAGSEKAQFPESNKRPAPSDASTEEQPAKKALSTSERKRQARANKAALRKSRPPPIDSPNFSAMRAHLFALLRPLVAVHTDIRNALARCPTGDLEGHERILKMIEDVVREGIQSYERENEGVPQASLPVTSDENTRPDDWEDSTEDSTAARERCKRPWWVCQPYIRPLPKEAMEKGALAPKLSKEEKEASKRAAERGRQEGEKVVGAKDRSGQESANGLLESDAAKEAEKEESKVRDGLISG